MPAHCHTFPVTITIGRFTVILKMIGHGIYSIPGGIDISVSLRRFRPSRSKFATRLDRTTRYLHVYTWLQLLPTVRLEHLRGAPFPLIRNCILRELHVYYRQMEESNGGLNDLVSAALANSTSRTVWC